MAVRSSICFLDAKTSVRVDALARAEVEATSAPRTEIPAETPKPPQRIASAAPKFEEQPTDSEGKPRYS